MKTKIKCICVSVIICIVGIMASCGYDNSTLEIEFLLRAMSGAENYVFPGGKMVTTDGIELGIVAVTHIEDTILYIENDDGDKIEFLHPDMADITGVIITKGSTINGFKINGNTPITVGERFLVPIGEYENFITVTAIRKTD